MNLDQIIKLGALQANAIKQDGTLAPFFSMAELVSWANDGNLEIEKMLRMLCDDYFAVVRNSASDTTKVIIAGIDYTPSVTMKLPANTPRITLPPDFDTLRSIRCVTDGSEWMEFEHQDMNSHIFQEYLRTPNTYNIPPGGRVYYDIIGERTMFFTPMITQDIDLELIYIADTRPLVRYTTGTVAIPDASTAVTGNGTVWSTGFPFDPAYMDIMVKNAAITFTDVDPSWTPSGVNLSRVASVTNDTAAVLASNKVGVINAASTYILSSVPALPSEHHAAIADYVTAQMHGKTGNGAQFDRYMAKWQTRRAAILNTINVRQPDVSFVEDYTTWS